MADHQGWLDNNYRGEPMTADPGECFIQWKGTDVCFDFRCPCGHDGHFDGYFAYAIECPKCKTVFEMPHLLYPRRIYANDNANPVVPKA